MTYYILKGPLTEWCYYYESALAKKGFLRLQKSFIANMSHINKISSYQVTLCDGTVIKASEKYYRRVHDGFLLWKGQHL